MDKKRSKGAGINKNRLDYKSPILLLQVEEFARDGYDNNQIAELLNVAPQTFSKHKNKKVDGVQSDLSEALEKGRRPLDIIVENAFYKRAIGQKLTETKVIKKREFNFQSGQYDIVVYDETITKEIPGDVQAQLNWLKNRKPEIWNLQPEKFDYTSKGKELPNIPRITTIAHINISPSGLTDKFEV